MLLCFISLSNKRIEKPLNKKIPVIWVDSFIGKDFSFKDEWSYPEEVFRNKYGQLSCDSGMCHGTKTMKDANGRILKDSLEAFYKIVDTTHLKHTLKSTARVYEWLDSKFITFKRSNDNSITGESSCSAATHSSLNIQIKNDSILTWVDFKSIRNLGTHQFPLKKGYIKIDKKSFKGGIIKAEFDLTFFNTIDESSPISWRGLIHSKINN